MTTPFRSALDPTGVAVVTIDVPGESVNTLGPAATSAFAELLASLGADSAVKGVVLTSGKRDSFIAGADINEFVKIDSAETGQRMSAEGHRFLEMVEQFPKPIVVAIHGTCLGLGLELSLSCTWRVASDHPKTQLGLPEIQLGILPGAGGCQRLPRLIGLRAALDIILAGKSERAAKAFRLGMVDELVPESILLATAIRAAARLSGQPKPTRPARARGLMGALLDRNPLGRLLVYRTARRQVMKRTGGHYPAPLRALRVIRTGLERGRAAGFAAEARGFGELAVSPVSRELVRIFFATTAHKKDDGVPPDVPVRPREVRRLGVVGAGFMGSAIAGTAVTQARVEARLKDADLPRVGRGIRAATSIIDGRLKRRRIDRHEHQRLASLVSGGIDFTGFGRADLVIEAVFEDLGVKRQVVAEIEAVVDQTALVATNTSTIPITEIAREARHPDRVLGMHFFSPVDRMPLLEVIPGERTGPDAIAAAVRFGRRMGKTVIVVADRPGFWVNRILSPYLAEATRMVSEGVPMEVVDRVAVRYGFPVGPITLLDEVGLDVAGKGAGVMHEAFGDRLKPVPALAKLLEAGYLGRKVGKGFYRYVDGKKAEPDPEAYRLAGAEPLASVDEGTVERRLVYSLLNEAVRAEAEGVVRQPRDGDVGAIFGIGFPPFRGGPLRALDAAGAPAVVTALEELAGRYGARFDPAPTLVERAASGLRYYP